MPLFATATPTKPYFPDLMRSVVDRVSEKFENLDEDPFLVLFDYGIMSQVGRDRMKRDDKDSPFIWLVMNFDEDMGKTGQGYEIPDVNILICANTDNTWSMEERDENNFKPILLPIYEELMLQIRREKKFGMPGEAKTRHKRIIRPYWGGGDVNGADTGNLFKQKVDAIQIRNLKLTVSRSC
jgi:hypothetical protein